jgi:hypothetical protein
MPLSTGSSHDEHDILAELSVRFRRGDIGPAGFYPVLAKMAQRHGIVLSATPALWTYFRYLALSDQLDAEALLRELKELEFASFEKLNPTPSDRWLVVELERLQLDLKLASFELTADDWRRWLKINAARAPIMAPFAEFYHQAGIRDQMMAVQMKEAMERNDARCAVMVVGGFHADEIARRLNDDGATVAIFTPRITRASNAPSPLSIFSQQKTPLENLVRGEPLFLAPPAVPHTYLDQKR